MDGLKRVLVLGWITAATSYCGAASRSVDPHSMGGGGSTPAASATAGKGTIAEQPSSSGAGGATALGVAGSHPSHTDPGNAGSTGVIAQAGGPAVGGASGSGSPSGSGGSSSNGGMGGSSASGGGSAGSNAIDCGGVVHDGELRIEQPADLAALAGVTQVTGTLMIVRDAIGPDLSALSSIRCIADLWVEKSSLVSTRGLNNAVYVNSLIFEDNDKLERIEGLDNLVKLNFVRLRGNRALTTMELPNKITQMVDMMLLGNEQLTRMDGFKNLQSMSANLFLEGVGFKDLSPLPALESVGTLRIASNPMLESFAGFGKLKQIAGNFVLDKNPMLDNVDALGTLQEIRGTINISANPKLTECEINKTLATVPLHNPPQISGSPPCTP